MRVRTWVAVGLAALVGLAACPARAQENPNPEQMRKMYDDALQRLKEAQERKNQLAHENEKLGQQVEAMKKELGTAQARLEELKRADAEHAEKTFFLRSHYMAWQQFARANPETSARWRAFIESDLLVNPLESGLLADRDWPTGTPRPPAATQAAPQTTQPVIQPAGTQPAGTQPAATQLVPIQPVNQPATSTPSSPATAPATQPAVPVPTTPASVPATAPAQPATTQPA